MRRRNYAWDSRQKKYVPAAEKYYGKTNANILQLNGVSKVDVVLSLFDQGELKVKDIAKQVGFENNLELAKFMKGKGYQWDPVIGNYVKSNEPIIEPVITETSGTQFSQNATLAEGLQNLVPILQNLSPQNQKVVRTEQKKNLILKFRDLI